MNLLQKLALIQRSVRGLGKNADGGQYTYVSGSKVLEAIRPQMDELGIILKQEIVSIENVRQDYTVGRDQRPKAEVLTTCLMRFTWIDTESGEREECSFAANGQNDWDKGVGSALTYGERYFLLKFFHIATDEDDCDALNAKREAEEQERAFSMEAEYAELIRRMHTRVTKAEVNAFYKSEFNRLPATYQKRWVEDCKTYIMTLEQ